MDIIYSFILNNWIGLLTILIGIPSAIVGIKEIYSWKNANNFVTNSPGGTPKHCIGRSSDIKKVRKKILKGEHLFIYGSAGIGKTTLVNSAIEGNRKKLCHKYDRVLFYDFSKNPDKEFAMNELCKLIPDRGTKDFMSLVNEKKYIIRLEGCENATNECLEDIINVSDNPTFILCSRTREQVHVLEKIDDSDDLVISLSTLKPRKALELLIGKFAFWNPFNRASRSINESIVRFVGCHPFCVYNIKINRLYKKNPYDFYMLLKDKGLDNTIDEKQPILFKQEHNMEVLLKMNFGLIITDQSEFFSSKTKTALGFLGFLADDAFPYDFEHELFDESVIKEISEIGLFTIGTKFNINLIQPNHSLVNKALYDNRSAFLENDYSSIFHFLALIGYHSMEVTDNYSSDMFNSACLTFYWIKNHLLCCVNNLISDNDIQLDDETKDHVNIVAICRILYLLSTYGMYNEVLNLIGKLEVRGIPITIPILKQLYAARYSCYDGLKDYDKCIELMTNLLLIIKEPISVLSYSCNIVEAYIYSKRFMEAGEKIQQVKEYRDKIQNKYCQEVSFLEQCLEIRSLEQLILWNLDDCNLTTFVENQSKLVKDLLEKYNYQIDDFIVIKALLLLIFAYYKKNDNRAKPFFEVLEQSLERWENSPGYYFVFDKIGDFFSGEKQFDKAVTAYNHAFIRSVNIFGNEHVITNQLRQKVITSFELLAPGYTLSIN